MNTLDEELLIDEEELQETEESNKLDELQLEESVGYDKKNKRVKFTQVIHSDRAKAKRRLSDGDTTKFLNAALEYFDYRCALSGEKFVVFDKPTEDGRKIKSNLSAEHMVPLCIGGDDIVPNLLPTVLHYNLQKNGYYPIDYWKQAKDVNGKSIYSPYRLLKAINYMMKTSTEEARKAVREGNIQKFKKLLFEPNEIDKFLQVIEETSLEKMFSETITDTELDVDNKKILRVLPNLERNIPTQYEQERTQVKEDKIQMSNIFFLDAIKEIESERDLANVEIEREDGTKGTILEFLNEQYQKIEGQIPFEIQIRNEIITELEKFGIVDNKYSVANELIANTEILELAKKDKSISKFLNERIEKLRNILNEEQVIKAISYMPHIMYRENAINRLKLWKEKRTKELDKLLLGNISQTDDFIDILIVLKNYKIDITDIKITDEETIESLLKGQNIDEEKQKEILDRVNEITLNNNIGTMLHSQKTNENKLKETLEEIGGFSKREIRFITTKKDATRDFVEILNILKHFQLDITDIKQNDTIEEFFKRQNIDDEQAKRIIEEINVITLNHDIGRMLTNQKVNEKKLQKALEEAGGFNEEEIKFLTNKKEKSKDATMDLIIVLKILRFNQLDITDIKITADETIETFLERQKIDEEQRKEIIGRVNEITLNHNIGSMLVSRRADRIIEKFKKLLEETRVFTPEEIKFLVTKKDATRELIEVLKILRIYQIDITVIQRRDTITDLLTRQNIDEEQQNEIIGIVKGITSNLRIGDMINTQKKVNEINFKKTIEEDGSFSEKEIRFLITKKDATRDFIEVLKILKEAQIDITDIKQGDTIEEFLKRQNINLKKQKEIVEKINVITSNRNIGKMFMWLKLDKNIFNLKKTIEEDGSFSEKEIRFLTTKKDATRDFIEVLKILKDSQINITDIKRGDTIKSILKRYNRNDKQTKEILEKVDAIGLTHNIYNTLIMQRKDEKKLKKALEEACDFSEDEISFLSNKREQSNDTTKDFIEVLKILKEAQIDITDIKKRDTIEEFLKRQSIDDEQAKEIIEKINGIISNHKIGERLLYQKTTNGNKLKKALEEDGSFSEEEIKFLTTKREKGKKVTKEAVIEEKNKGQLGENIRIENMFNSEIRQIESREEGRITTL